MATSDPQNDAVIPAGEQPRTGPPQIIDLPSTFDMGEFPSEEQVAAAAEPEPQPDHAPVLDFSKPRPVAVPEPVPTPASATAPETTPDEALTLLQVLERNEHVSWQEAVAIVLELCTELKDVPSHAPVLIEPGAIQITAAGQLHLLASQQGGDPLVIQLGRLLRSMVSKESVPSELRLLISQATFELAIFDSVDQFARALAKWAGPANAGGVKAVFRRTADRPVEKYERPVATAVLAPTRPLLPEPVQRPRRMPRLPRSETSWLAGRGAVTAAVLVGVALIGSLISKNLLLGPGPQVSQQSVVATPPPQQQQVAAPPTAAPSRPHPVETATTGKSRVAEKPSSVATRPARPERPAPKATRDEAPRAAPTAPAAIDSPSSAARGTASPSTNESPADLIRRAGALFNDGKASDAAIVLDLLVLTAPLYEPAPGELPREAAGAFHASQRLLLPNIASQELDRAGAALSAGDPDRAIVLGHRAEALLDRFDPDASSPLRPRLQQLLRRAGTARTTVENTVYGTTDGDVTPPEPLSRQFPEGAPQGVPPQRVGTLELIVGKAGDVEFVKLHTPLNRYHERMIVSAVKAWRYRPATRAGKPVRFRLTISINLPESGNASGSP